MAEQIRPSAPYPLRRWNHEGMSEGANPAVDLVLNTFERTYRRVLEPQAIEAIRSSNGYPFARCVVLINNVEEIADATRRAERLLAEEVIDEFHLVSNHLELALTKTGLRRSDLEPLLHYSDGPIVAATLPGSPWFLYWDPEARLSKPVDWISGALALMSRDERVMVANPSWELPDAEGKRPGLEREGIETRDGFAIGPGFSDQIFLASRATLAAPIYDQRCIARITYPGAHKAHVFEARVGAHMRHSGRLRATSLATTYVTQTVDGGSSYPPQGIVETARFVRNAFTLRALGISPWKPRCLRNTWL